MTDSLAVFTDTFLVDDQYIDGNGHVNNVAYVQWMQDVAIAHFASRVDADVTAKLGCTWFARSHSVEYLTPAFAGEALRVSTWIVNWRRVRSTRKYRFERPADGHLVAIGETDWVFVDVESGRPRSIPDEIRNQFELVSEEG